jgi:hypothetical protein
VSEQPMVPVADFERSRKPDRREGCADKQVPRSAGAAAATSGSN